MIKKNKKKQLLVWCAVLFVCSGDNAICADDAERRLDLTREKKISCSNELRGPRLAVTCRTVENGPADFYNGCCHGVPKVIKLKWFNTIYRKLGTATSMRLFQEKFCKSGWKAAAR